ncbi:MAG TPA: T9SS type A sorting domain-containing protein [Pedobacter sp.]|jgi:hypothetical protein
MKVIILKLSFFILLNIYNAGAQNRVKFEYDTAGNQTRRYVCINCGARNIPAKDSLAAVSEESITDIVVEGEKYKITYYPNPVREELHINWINNDIVISEIVVYSISGQTLKRFPPSTGGAKQSTISFEDYAHGYYTVVLISSDGKEYPIKIVKN